MKTIILAAASVVALAAGMSAARAADAVTVMTYIDAVPDQFAPHNEEKVQALLKQMNVETQGEPGLISFTVLQETGRPNHFALLEKWKDRAAFSTHLATAHTREFRNALQPLIGSPYDMLVTTAMQ